MATLYVHIGTPKTGTSSIQAFLGLNQENLAEHGICYAYMDLDFAKSKFKLHRNGNFLVHSAYELEGEEKEQKEQVIYQQGFDIIKEAAQKYEKILVTDEAIWYRQNNKDNFWQTVMKDAKDSGCSLKVIVYLRRQDLYIEAWYNQAVKYYPRTVKTFKKYLKSKAVRMHNLDYYKKLKEIADCIGRENLIVRVFEKQLFLGSEDGLYQDFLDALGEQMQPEYILPGRIVNDSLGGNFVEIKRLINQVPEFQTMKDFMKVPVIHASNIRKHKKVSYFDYEGKIAFLSQYEESNQQIAKEFLGKEDGILFTEPVGDLPKWEVDESTMYKDIIHVFTEICIEQQQQIDALKKNEKELQKELQKEMKELNKEIEELKKGFIRKIYDKCRNLLKRIYRKIRKRC